MSGTPYLIAGNSAASGGSTSLSQTVTPNVASTDVIYVGVGVTSAGVTVSVADSQFNQYTQILSDTTETANQLYIFEATGVNPLTAGVDTITVTYSTNVSQQGFVAVGDNNVSGADKAIIAHGSGTAISTGSSGTLSQKEEHAIVFICNAYAGGNPAYASPWSTNVLADQGMGTTAIISAAWQDVTATTALTGSATQTTTTWTAALITDLVNPVTLTVPNTLADGVANEAYSQTLSAAGGISGYTYAITSGSLPTGLSLSGGVISGTPTVAGSYTFTITITDSQSVTGTSVQTIVILASGASGVAVQTLEGQLLSAQDQDLESSGVGTWAAETNASSLARVTTMSGTGSASLSWIATSNGQTQVHTGFYSVTAGKSYVASGLIMPCAPRDTQIGIEWYTSGGSLISTSLGPDNPSGSIAWQPLYANGTAPATATQCKITYLVQEANAGDVTHTDTTYLAQSGAQILIDWVNPAFASPSSAGNDFMDVTPWLRGDQGISLNRGRQDAVSEIMAGSASFQLQNDSGIWTRYLSNTLVGLIGGDQTLQRRVQVNLTDELGNWWTRYDGPISEIDYSFDDLGITSIAAITVTDILAELNRQDGLSCWTKELVLSDNPALHWTLDDAGNAGGVGVAAESSGNNGPPMRLLNTDTSATATIGWQDTSSGVETLADAVAPGQPDGSEYWIPPIPQEGIIFGPMTTNTQLRGLDSGVVGPYTTPLPSVFLTPKLVAQAGQNYFVGNTGYQFQTTLPNLINPNATGANYSFEIWFTEPGSTTSYITDITGDYGPYTLFSLGNSRTGQTLLVAIEPATNHLTFQVLQYSQPPSFVGKNFSSTAPPAFTSQVSNELTADKIPVPHHLVVTIQGDPSAPLVIAYLDGALFSDEFTSMNLSKGTIYDTITVGGVFGGTGAYWGNLQLMSIYDYLMSGQQVINHAQMGQYGMWEQATDNCVAQLGVFAGIPSFWNNLSGASDGLTLTEYQDITGANALTNMQLYEQTELGLLFVDATGKLNFHTRDWRQGHGAPDLYLPPNTFEADMGMETIDQFQINEQAVATQIFQTGASFINTASQEKYGTYATAGVGSPIQLPLITWNRAYSQLGLSSFFYWSDPYLADYCAWLANSRAEPWLVPGQLTIDLLALNKSDSGGVGISSLYALEIDNLIAPSGTVPSQFPNASLSTEWFIEGINETWSTTARTIQFYTSPAEPQRAWKAGDATYGVLGTSTRIGISAPSTNTPVADGKDVSHDAGPGYWSPTFTTSEAINDQAAFTTGANFSEWAATNGTLAQDESVTYPSGPGLWSIVGTGTGGAAVTVKQSGTNGAAAVTVGEVVSVGAWIFSPGGDTVTLGVEWQTSGHSNISASTGAGVSVPANIWTFVAATGLTAPATTAFAYVTVASSTNNAVMVVQEAKIVQGMNAPADMNNPANSGNGFVGAVDIRGLTYNLGLALNPPMLVVGCTSKTQSFATGSDATPSIFWDNVYVDTQGGMGLIPGYPNWYVVTVPGFYDIDASVVWATTASGNGAAAQGYIVVAEGAAQAVAAGTANPNTVDQYVCPIGEQVFLNNHTWNCVAAPSTRMYLGIGDMVTIAAEHDLGSTLATAATYGGSKMSLLWRGYAQYDDRQQINASITGGAVGSGKGGGGGPPPAQTTYTKTYKNVATYAYYGAAINYQRKSTNGSAYQGTYSGGEYVTGSETSLILMPWSTIQSDLSGATVEAIALKCTNQHTWYDSGGTLLLGWSRKTSGAATNTYVKGTDFPNVYRANFAEGQTRTLSIPVSTFGGALQSELGCFMIGDFSTTNLDYYGYWAGGANSWALTITYKK